MAARKPLSFSMDTAEPVPPTEPVPAARSVRMSAVPPNEERQQIGARIRATTYRQLKARAALEGRKVQDLVELAVEEFLAKPTS